MSNLPTIGAEDIHIIPQTIEISLIPKTEFDRIWASKIDLFEQLNLIADMCRANTLAGVKRAGSGHLGSSLSAMDIVVWLYYHVMNTVQIGLTDPDRDIYFSSKGHDVPGLYAVLFSLGIIPTDKFLKLRRLGGLDGHPDVGIPGIEANSGSLGMGISKGKGMAWAKRLKGLPSRVFVLTGDGEWQEGQNYEALQTAAHQHIGNLTVIVDNNKVQSDKLVSEIINIGDLEAKFAAFGWQVARCDGHDFAALAQVFEDFANIHDRPKILIADTIKGRGVSFMEHPFALANNGGLYPWHAGAPDDEAFTAAYREVLLRINERLQEAGLEPVTLESVSPEPKTTSTVSDEYVTKAYGEALVEIGAKRKDLVVLDADLAIDCKIREFEAAYPARFVENGIAEQDMVSMAAGIASQGLLPVVNSFASFLAARANEQIYNATTEKRKIIYGCNFAGLIPAGPGRSHQSIRDISLFGALPNMVIVQPGNATETRLMVDYAINQTSESVMIRLAIGPSPRLIALPIDYQCQVGRGAILRDGADAVLFAYGPVMLHEALLSSDILAIRGIRLKVVNMAWLNRVDDEWLMVTVAECPAIYVLDDHAPIGGLGDFLLNALVRLNLLERKSFHKFAIEGLPACGTPAQALDYHRLSGNLLAEDIAKRELPHETAPF
ncbi:MAG: 1-deoxy-D-xylulose-5-phosphate synthase [Chloroflexi bacterium]|nr:1-deoxy-D-xylulose-5-phosphate synthase [Chloroflexota bacterium]